MKEFIFITKKNRRRLRFLAIYDRNITGILHEGESFLDCLKREMNEEVGIVDNDIISIDPMFFSFTWNKKDGRLIHDFTYSVHISHDFFPKISPLEHDEYKWQEFDDAIETLHTDNNKAALKRLYQIQKGAA